MAGFGTGSSTTLKNAKEAKQRKSPSKSRPVAGKAATIQAGDVKGKGQSPKLLTAVSSDGESLRAAYSDSQSIEVPFEAGDPALPSGLDMGNQQNVRILLERSLMHPNPPPGL